MGELWEDNKKTRRKEDNNVIKKIAMGKDREG